MIFIKIADMMELIDGDRGKNYPKKIEYLKNGHCLFLSTKNVRPDGFKFEEKVFITKEKHKTLRNGTLQRGDVVITTRGTIGNVGIYDEQVPFDVIRINSGMLILRLNKGIYSKKLLSYFIQSPNFIFQIKKGKSGTAQPQLPAGILKDFEIPLFPLPEQHRIVAKIEELFSHLDSGIDSLKKAQAQLKIYRQSVLKYAFEGKLTEEWRKQHQPEPAEKLLEQIRLERERHHQQQLEEWKAACKQVKAEGKKKPTKPRKPKELPSLTEDELGELPGLPEGWIWCLNEEINVNITDGDHQPPPKSKKGIPFITISNIKNNKIDFSNTFFVNNEYYFKKLNDTRRPQKNDILYTVTGSFGIPVLLNFNKKFCFQRHIGLLRPYNTNDIKYIFYCLQTSFVYNQAQKTATGTAQKTVSLGSLRNFKLPLCSLMEQQAIVQEIESRISVCDKLEQDIETNLKKAEALRQSILKKAFEGRLVPQNPDDEPAEKLLERIKLEKAELEAKAKATKAKKRKTKPKRSKKKTA